ncbi:hypothetical protein MLD38_017241 [Melastoma candidum]|uniref:Uncharacterized protein n=1 Tax=Melastoma candidum TaxID=119954 RepID=A0ACB9QP78_9MYRT|nr:hypothetical protein MLD38_017241 [Melastoma candidum]
MKLGSVLQFLDNKSILVTGAAGFLAKIFVEKVLRVQPNVKKLYLLLRADDAKSAAQRLQSDVLEKELFRVLREKCGEDFSSLISDKVITVAGDITFRDLGLKDSELRDQMLDQINVIINLAATTKFDERYDVALNVNTLGTQHVVEFARKCNKLTVLVHVSTAYVSGEREGMIQETPYKMGETLNGAMGLDIDEELKIVGQRLEELKRDGVPEKETRIAMKELGIKRAKVYGWPNTYVFTKAIGEMVVGELKGEVPVVILRPTIVTSTYREPFPGWAEGVRTVDSLAVGYGTGKLTCFLGDIDGIVDIIPADMVVNSIMVAMTEQAGRPGQSIYQVGTSTRNPIRYRRLQEFALRYFTTNPYINKKGKPVKVGEVKVLKNMDSFHRFMTLRYLLWLKGLELVNAALCKSFEGTCNDLNKKIKFIMRLVELYRPYLFFKGLFDDANTENLRAALRESDAAEADSFCFDPTCINWEDYAMNVHIPGIVKYVFK